jgi:peptidoglycan hydrolase-like amidase
MKLNKTLFIFFFLALFVFQQTQVDAQKSPYKDSLSSNFQTIDEWPEKVKVLMYEFNPETGAPTNNLCYYGSTVLGCVEPNDSGLVYPPVNQYVTFPHGGSNPILVDMEHYYLYNVLPREMDVKTYPPTTTTLPALKVQALAARSIADWKAVSNPIYVKYITNTTDKQVFVPGSFEYYNPSATSLIQRAVDETSGEYPSYNGMSIDAEFSNDIVNPTRDGTSWTTYLVSVQEPISPSCDLSPAETSTSWHKWDFGIG